jgi:hypothetical protein
MEMRKKISVKYWITGAVVYSLIVCGVAGVAGCKTMKITKSRMAATKPSSKQGSARSSKTPADSSGAVSANSSASEPLAVKSLPLSEESFVLAKTLTGVVLSSKAKPFHSVVTGHVLIPVCPTENADCKAPSIYVFSPESGTISHIITPNSAFIPYDIDGDTVIRGLSPGSWTGQNFANLSIDLTTILLNSATVTDDSVPAPSPVSSDPIAIAADVTSSGASASDGRAVACNPSNAECFIPESSGCGSGVAGPSLRSYTVSGGYGSFCQAYPVSTKLAGFTANNEIVFSETGSDKTVYTFQPLQPLPLPVDPEALTSDAPQKSSIEVLGNAGPGDPFSMLDNANRLLLAFSTINNKNGWTAVQLHTKNIVGQIPLDLSMAGHGTFFIPYTSSLVEVRPGTGGNPPGIYVISQDKIYSVPNN